MATTVNVIIVVPLTENHTLHSSTHPYSSYNGVSLEGGMWKCVSTMWIRIRCLLVTAGVFLNVLSCSHSIIITKI